MHFSIKALVLPVVLLFSGAASAQITLEHVYTNQNTFLSLPPANLSYHGKKLIGADTGSYTVNLYNMDHTLFKSITIPQIPGYDFKNVFIVSDNLFNLDNQVEMVVTYYNYNQTPKHRSTIINESGSLVKDLDSTAAVSIYKDDNDNYKLKAYNSTGIGDPYYTYRIYSLIGSLPCDNCNALKTGSIQKSAPFISGPIPNPSDGIAIINYILPEGDYEGTLTFYDINGRIVATYPLSGLQNSFRLNAKFAPGTYIYNIQTSSGLSDSQKLTVK